MQPWQLNKCYCYCWGFKNLKQYSERLCNNTRASIVPMLQRPHLLLYQPELQACQSPLFLHFPQVPKCTFKEDFPKKCPFNCNTTKQFKTNKDMLRNVRWITWSTSRRVRVKLCRLKLEKQWLSRRTAELPLMLCWQSKPSCVVLRTMMQKHIWQLNWRTDNVTDSSLTGDLKAFNVSFYSQ